MRHFNRSLSLSLSLSHFLEKRTRSSVLGGSRIKVKQVKYFAGVWFALFAMGILVAPERIVWAQSPSSSGSIPPVAIVEETAESVLTPVQQVAVDPVDLYEQIIVLTSEPLPAQWLDAGGQVPIAATATTPASVLTITVSASVVSVVFWDSTGQTTRYGYGIRSEVTLDPGNGSPVSHSGAFKMKGESASAGDAIDGALELEEAMVQSRPVGGGGGIGSTYSNCVATCLSLAHGIAFDTLWSCAGLTKDAAFLVAGTCALTCALGNPVLISTCIAACLALAGVPLSILAGACMAAYLATLFASIPLCILGCIGV